MKTPQAKIEWERKFLLDGVGWKAWVTQKSLIQQAYLCTCPECVVRVRLVKDQAFLTIKGKNHSQHPLEFETQIAVEDGQQLLNLCSKPAIIKQRYELSLQPGGWIVDQFLNQNQGLWLVEVECETQNELSGLKLDQDWLGTEVSQDFRFTNAYLYQQPYSSWAVKT